jgi:hypothetical protein
MAAQARAVQVPPPRRNPDGSVGVYWKFSMDCRLLEHLVDAAEEGLRKSDGSFPSEVYNEEVLARVQARTEHVVQTADLMSRFSALRSWYLEPWKHGEEAPFFPDLRSGLALWGPRPTKPVPNLASLIKAFEKSKFKMPTAAAQERWRLFLKDLDLDSATMWQVYVAMQHDGALGSKKLTGMTPHQRWRAIAEFARRKQRERGGPWGGPGQGTPAGTGAGAGSGAGAGTGAANPSAAVQGAAPNTQGGLWVEEDGTLAVEPTQSGPQENTQAVHPSLQHWVLD